MRSVFLILRVLVVAAAFAACVGATSELASAPQEDDDGDGTGSGSGSGNAGNSASCSSDDECVAAGATCCECPSYATRADDPSVAACAEVDCSGEEMSTCSATRAVCDDGACRLACEAVTCSNSCPDGYARDANGCLTCECAIPPSNGCTADTQCTQVRGDCCGCARGGSDTAVPRGTEASHDQMLGCSTESQCPEVDTCVAGDAPQCIQGFCSLAQPLPIGACGRDDLAACAACIVNANDQADMHGVGVCQSP